MRLWYRIVTRAGDPLPQPGTARYAQAYTRVYITAICLYLVFTLYEAYDGLLRAPTFYDLLSVPHTASAADLKSRFRRLTVLFHPDKAGSAGVQHFLTLKHAYDVLSDPTRRFAYDHFGPAMLQCTHCSAAYDYVLHGVHGLGGYYGVTAIVLIALSALGKFKQGRWWRFLVLAAMAALEGMVLSRPHAVLPSIPFTKPLLPFEQAALARKVALASLIALNQLGSFLAAEGSAGAPATTAALEARLEQLALHIELEAAKARDAEFLPFGGDVQARSEVERKMADWMFEAELQRDPEMKDAMDNALKRLGRAGADGSK